MSPASVTQYGPARIIALSGDAYPTGGNFVLGAGVDSKKTATYDVRLRTTATNQYGMPSLTSVNGALTASLTHVVYTKNNAGETKLYLNGALAAKGSITGNFSNWDNYALSLGNEPAPSLGDRPWLGTLHLAAIYSRALNETEVGLNYQAGTSKP